MKKFIKSKKILLMIILSSVLLPMQAYSLQKSTPLATDNRLRTYIYNPNDIYVYTGYYRYQSSIIFALDEEILTVTMGDTLGWQMIPQGNRLFLKPISPEANTNMTILTNKREYLFELYADEAEDIRDEEMTFTAKFIYPNEISEAALFTFGSDDDDERNEDIANIAEEEINRNYSFSGSSDVAPLQIFDDGEFTFFEFKDKNAELPAIFSVDRFGNEELVNFRVKGNYLVIEKVVQQFTLRRGVDITCIFNEANPLRVVDLDDDDDKFLGLF